MDDREDLSRRLWLLRQQLEQLLCALDIQQLVLANDRLRWLPMVSENVEQLVDDIRQSDADRVAVSNRLTHALGLPDDATLGELADAAGEPYTQMWRQHRLHLLGLHAEIDGVTQANFELSRRGAATTREIVGALTGNESHTYDAQAYGPGVASGARRDVRPTSSIFDRSV
ncbi:MAG TPA: flagellar export chaperone FlgN [Ilumatobacter sp.]|nr:flagellar export chaperone FlgN [Ilumatobacter sp.]